MLFFLKEAALEPEWTPTTIAQTLGVKAAVAKQIAGELALVGYAEPVPRKRDAYRNTHSGNAVAGDAWPEPKQKKCSPTLPIEPPRST